MLSLLLTISDVDDRERINQIFKAYHRDMLKVARHKFKGDPNCAFLSEDAVENALFKITKYIKSINLEGDALRAYVITVTVNECINIKSEESDDLSLSDDFPDKSFDEESFIELLDLHERYAAVIEGIKLLPDKYRVPLFLCYARALSPDDIAEQMGIPVKTVYTRLRRGREMLRIYVERRFGK